MARQRREGNVMLKKWEGTSFDSKEEFLAKCNRIGIEYLCCGEEICPTTGRHHLQFYLQTRNRIRLSTIGNARHLGCTVFPLRREVKAAIDYIIENPEKPEPIFFEIGNRPREYNQTERNANNQRQKAERAEVWKQVIKLARQGKFDKVADEHPGIYIRSYQTLRKIYADSVQKPQKDNIQCIKLEGSSGCGKTQFLKEYFQRDDVYFYNKNPQFFERYDQEQTLVIDDLDKRDRHMLNQLKVTCDTIPQLLNLKFGSMWSNVRKIFITSQYSWLSLIGKKEDNECIDPELLEALSRRFTTFIVMGRDIKTNDLSVCFKDDPIKMFPFSLRNYLLQINFI